ncbi:MAG: C40 family peptidase [Bacteroidales bacterium]|nr:C40 family peptidase [Bacteroidales bacterium]
MILTSILTWAVVTLSSTFMRPSPDYEAPLDNQLLMGALVQTTGETERYWVKVTAEDYTGWVTDLGLKYLTDDEKDAYLEASKWICVAEYARIREQPSENSAPMCDFTMGDLVRQTGGWKHGWVEVLLPDGRKGWVLGHQVMDFRTWAGSRSGLAADDSVGRSFCAREITSMACSFAGTPYMWGGNSIKHFDCSGLVKFCYFMNGIILPRNASQQIKCGTAVKDGEWLPGDLLFFGSKKPLRVTHVAIYLGDGKIVHSSQMVRINDLKEYGREVVGATRILGDVDRGKGAISILKSSYYFEQDGE